MPLADPFQVVSVSLVEMHSVRRLVMVSVAKRANVAVQGRLFSVCPAEHMVMLYAVCRAKVTGFVFEDAFHAFNAFALSSISLLAFSTMPICSASSTK